MRKDDFGNRMKLYEKFATYKFLPLQPVIVRIDGKRFSKLTRKLKKPFDQRMVNIMIDVTKTLVDETNAIIGYTQSDEITLVLYSDSIKRQIYYDGKMQKIVSVLASVATERFNELLNDYIPPSEICGRGLFDCRAFSVPTLSEAANAVLWREQDASKNSISSAASHYFSHKSLQGLSGNEKQHKLITEANINWSEYPDFFKRGVFIQKKLIEKPVTEKMRKFGNIPDSQMTILRSSTVVVKMPNFSSVTNRIGVIFNDETPETF